MESLGSKSRSELIAMVENRDKQIARLKEQASLSDRILDQRSRFRESAVQMCVNCGLTPAVDDRTCVACAKHVHQIGLGKIWVAEEKEDWRGMCRVIPPIQFPAHWIIKLMMPFGGACARFMASLDNENWISVYFDAFDRLGFVGRPYWEIYPIEGDIERFIVGEEDQLLKKIEKVLQDGQRNGESLISVE